MVEPFTPHVTGAELEDLRRRLVIELLTDAGFNCVVPSLPGYAWSDKPARPGWNVERIARGCAALMARLGYDRYGAVGSDWGTSISASVGQQDPEHVPGIHLLAPHRPRPHGLQRLPLRAAASSPTGCSVFPYGLQRPTCTEAEQRFADIRSWSEPTAAATSPPGSKRRYSRPRSQFVR